MAENTNKIYFCPVEVALDLIGGKWKPMLLTLLREGDIGLEEIRRCMPFATSEKLARQLRELERDGLIERREPLGAPQYSLTFSGLRLIPVLDQLRLAGRIFADRSNIRIDDALEFFKTATDQASSKASC